MYFQIWDFLSTEGFQPHGMCLLWRPDVFWTHVVSDLVIALSYFSIPTALLYLVSRRSDLMYRWVIYLFGAFIVACGVTHLFSIWTLWVPDYGIEALLKLATATVSVVTAIALWPLMPKLLALPSAGRLEEANAELAHEIEERHRAERELQALNEDLEKRVVERTQTLERVNQELVHSRALAEQANRAKSDFLAMMSHELRTPLNAIIGFSDVIRNPEICPESEEKRLQYAHHIHDSGQLLLELINDILDLSKIESGAEQLHEVWSDLAAVIAAVVKLTEHSAERSGLALKVALAPDLPAFFCDPRKMKQILLNLLSNSVKYTPQGGEIRIEAGLAGDGGIKLSVCDNGIGIPPEDIPRAFTPFQQVNSYLSRNKDGTGLGLPLTKALVEMHGGELELTSAKGAGTTVTLTFPPARNARGGNLDEQGQGTGTAGD
jgi:signal transduction histidine kinase